MYIVIILYILTKSQYVNKSLCLTNLFEQAFSFGYEDSLLRSLEVKRREMESQIWRFFGPVQSKILCNCPTFSAVIVCFPV